MMMNFPLRVALAMGALSGVTALSGTARAQSAASAGQAEATVVQPVAVAATADLDFGVVVQASDDAVGFATFSDSTALVFSGGARSGCGAVSGCPSPHRARFVVTGEQGRAYRVTTPSSLKISGVLVSSTPGLPAPPQLLVDLLSVWVAGAKTASVEGFLGADGRSSFEIGGRLSIPVAAAPARYHADIAVVVTYL
jgi:hypothetical protein